MDAAADGEPRAPAAGEDSGKRVGRATGIERARVGRACEAVWVAALGPEQCVLAVYFQINRILEKKIKEPKQICRHDRMCMVNKFVGMTECHCLDGFEPNEHAQFRTQLLLD